MLMLTCNSVKVRGGVRGSSSVVPQDRVLAALSGGD